MKKFSFLVLAASLFAPLACSSTGTASEGGTPTVRRSQNVIQAAELAGAQELNAFEAIQRFRNNWLRIRGQTTFGNSAPQSIKVYVNGSRRTDLDDLKRIRVSDVARIRFMNGSEATARYGTDHSDGAIFVTMKTR